MNDHSILALLFLKKMSSKLARTQTLTGSPSWGIGFDFRQIRSVMMTVLLVAVGNFSFWSRLEV